MLRPICRLSDHLHVFLDIELPIYTSHNKLTWYLDKPIDASNLIASFSTERGKLYINNKEQKDGVTANDFSEIISNKFALLRPFITFVYMKNVSQRYRK